MGTAGQKKREKTADIFPVQPAGAGTAGSPGRQRCGRGHFVCGDGGQVRLGAVYPVDLLSGIRHLYCAGNGYAAGSSVVGGVQHPGAKAVRTVLDGVSAYLSTGGKFPHPAHGIYGDVRRTHGAGPADVGLGTHRAGVGTFPVAVSWVCGQRTYGNCDRLPEFCFYCGGVPGTAGFFRSSAGVCFLGRTTGGRRRCGVVFDCAGGAMPSPRG